MTDKDGKAHYVLSGTWDDKMEFSRVMQSSKGENGTEGKQRTVYQTLKAKEIWKKNPLPWVYVLNEISGIDGNKSVFKWTAADK